MEKNRARFIKLKVVKYYILNGCLYWKYPKGILLNCLLEDEAKKISKEFHEGDLWWTPLLESNSEQDFKGWILLANHVL